MITTDIDKVSLEVYRKHLKRLQSTLRQLFATWIGKMLRLTAPQCQLV